MSKNGELGDINKQIEIVKTIRTNKMTTIKPQWTKINGLKWTKMV